MRDCLATVRCFCLEYTVQNIHSMSSALKAMSYVEVIRMAPSSSVGVETIVY
jgi:hypothetical protein